MKAIFDDLDQLIEQAVASATKTEKSMQKKQEKAVEERGLNAKKEENKDDVEEADEDKKSKKDPKDDESAEKIKGKPPEEKVPSAGDAKKSSDATPGTKTSKKLADPPEKVIANPSFSDISNKVNALRGSSSLKDEKISGAVKTYLGTLSAPEKSALLTYLTNLAQIMAPVKSPKDVKDPSEQGIKIAFKKNSSIEKEKKSTKAEEPKQKGNEPADVVVVGGK